MPASYMDKVECSGSEAHRGIRQAPRNLVPSVAGYSSLYASSQPFGRLR